MLLLKPNCELCDKDLPPTSEEACICTYECTYCKQCVSTTLQNVCPNCGGGFQPRPIRPQTARREGVSLQHQPASTKRGYPKYSDENIAELVEQTKHILPVER